MFDWNMHVDGETVSSLNENQEFRGLDQSILHNTSRNNAFHHDNRKCQLILQMEKMCSSGKELTTHNLHRRS